MNTYQRIYELLLLETARASAGSAGPKLALPKNKRKRERRKLARRGQFGWRTGTPTVIHVGPDPEPQD